MKSQLTFVYMDSGDPGWLSASIPTIPSLSPRHPAPQARCNSHILKAVVWLCFIPSCYVLSSIYAFILLLLLERVSSSGCQCDNCFPDLVQFSVSCLSLCAHGGPCTDSHSSHLTFCASLFEFLPLLPEGELVKGECGSPFIYIPLVPREFSPHPRYLVNICRVMDK